MPVPLPLATFVARRMPALLLGAGLLSGAPACTGGPAPGIEVAVAANFAEVAEQLAERFTDETGVPVRLVVGSTGGLTAQILAGAPYHIFLAADTARPVRLEAEEAAIPGSRFTYAIGRLAVMAPDRADDWTLPDLLAEPGVRVAWPDPRTAPYGAAALEALGRWGIAGIEGAVATSVAQSWQFAASGAVDAAFVSLAQVVTGPAGESREVPDSLYAPIRQQAVLLRAGEVNEHARRFLELLRNPEVREMIRASGYEVEDAADVG